MKKLFMFMLLIFVSNSSFSQDQTQELQDLINSSCLGDGMVRLNKDYTISKTVNVTCVINGQHKTISMDGQNKTIYVTNGSLATAATPI